MKKYILCVFFIIGLFGGVWTCFCNIQCLIQNTKGQTTIYKGKKILTSTVKNEDVDDNVGISSRSAVVLEGSTGRVLYEKEKDSVVNPASITKIMTLLLIYEAMDEGKIKLSDMVSVSEHAASMGGSQVYLEPGEQQTVETLIKCIAIASANDGAVAMAEHISGSEAAFVTQMNKKAKQLGMKNTKFVNCCGLDVNGHYSSAYDVAIMSRELITKYPQIVKYTTTWMDTIIHHTRKGDKEFGLSNTNKLVRTYDGITGLKTGSTSLAKYCLSATAKRNDIDIIAVVMGAPEHKLRYSEAAKLLDYGFSKVSKYEHKLKKNILRKIPVQNGTKECVEGMIYDDFTYIKIDNEKTNITYEVKLEKLKAPIKKNSEIGTVIYYNVGKRIGERKVYAVENIAKRTYVDEFTAIYKKLICR